MQKKLNELMFHNWWNFTIFCPVQVCTFSKFLDYRAEYIWLNSLGILKMYKLPRLLSRIHLAG